MYNYLIKNGSKVAMLVAFVISLLFLLFAKILMGDSTLKEVSNGAQYLDKSYFDFGLICMVVLLFVSISLFLFFSAKTILISALKNKKILYGALGMLLLFLILFVINRNETNDLMKELLSKYEVSNNVSAVISSGLIIGVFLFFIATASIILAEVRNSLKS